MLRAMWAGQGLQVTDDMRSGLQVTGDMRSGFAMVICDIFGDSDVPCRSSELAFE